MASQKCGGLQSEEPSKMPTGFIVNENERKEEKTTIQHPESVVIGQMNGKNDPPLEASSPAVCVIANSGSERNEEEKSKKRKDRKRGNYYHELWSESDSKRRKKMRIETEINDQDILIQHKSCINEQRPCKKSPKRAKNRKCPSKSAQKKQSCRRTYYRKRRYCCPGNRRYRASKRCCPKKYNRNRINLCNRNWSRISINPFINFLREFRRKFCKGTSITEIARKGKCEWKKMSCNSKKRFYEQAKRARIRGYRT